MLCKKKKNLTSTHVLNVKVSNKNKWLALITFKFKLQFLTVEQKLLNINDTKIDENNIYDIP